MKNAILLLVNSFIYFLRSIHLILWVLYYGKVPQTVYFKTGKLKVGTVAHNQYVEYITVKSKTDPIGIYKEYRTLRDGLFANFIEITRGTPRTEPKSASREICFLF